MRISDWSSDVCSSDLCWYCRRCIACCTGIDPACGLQRDTPTRHQPARERRRDVGTTRRPQPCSGDMHAFPFTHTRAARCEPEMARSAGLRCAAADGDNRHRTRRGRGRCRITEEQHRYPTKTEEHTYELQSLMRTWDADI